MPRRFIFERNVLGGIPSSSAAPSLPEIRPPHSLSTLFICARSIASRLLLAGSGSSAVAGCIANAVARAIGTRVTHMPMTPERIMAAIKAAIKAAKA